MDIVQATIDVMTYRSNRFVTDKTNAQSSVSPTLNLTTTKDDERVFY